MTREEAITYLQVIWNRYKAEYEIERETLDAYNMAIETLQAEPKTKCVARIEVDTEEVVKRIKEEYDITDGWIPCSERLPNKNEWGYYLVTVKGTRLFVDVVPFNEKLWKGLSSNQEVLAWMPLPKPYREDDEA